MNGVLLDTSALLAFLVPSHERNQIVSDMILQFRNDGLQVIVAPQSLYELYVVMTRPISANGFGKSCAEATGEVRMVAQVFSVLPDPPSL